MADDTGPRVLAAAIQPPVCGERSLPRILLVSRNRLLCEALTAALSRAGMFDVAHVLSGCTPDAPFAPSPDVLLLDMSVHDADAISRLRLQHPLSKVLVMGVADIDQAILAYACTGVSGFVSHDASIAELISTIHSAMRGELVCSPRIAGMLLSQVHLLAARERAAASSDALTAREREIASLMGRGLSNKQIARSLSVQNATVKNHVHSILGKLGVHRRGEVITRFHRMDAGGDGQGLGPLDLQD